MTDVKTSKDEQWLSFDKEVFAAWCILQQHLSLHSHSAFAAFLIHNYKNNIDPNNGQKRCCEHCGISLVWMCPVCTMSAAFPTPATRLMDRLQKEDTPSEESRNLDLKVKLESLLEDLSPPVTRAAAAETEGLNDGKRNEGDAQPALGLSPVGIPSSPTSSPFSTNSVSSENCHWSGLEANSKRRIKRKKCTSSSVSYLPSGRLGALPENNASLFVQSDRDGTAQKSNKRGRKKGSKLSTEDRHCRICNKTFTWPTHLKRHMIIHSGKRPFVCEYCMKGFADQSSLRAHRMIHTTMKNVQCEECGMTFLSRRDLRLHIKSNHESHKKYDCRECSSTFSSIHNLKLHEKAEHGLVRLHMCERCGKTMTSAQSLRIHRMSHTGEKPHICDVCNKAFSTRKEMKRHRFLHTGEKPHVCETCGKAFADIKNYRTHRMIHTQRTPFICSMCSKGFMSNQALQKHLLLHSDIRAYICDVCGKGFTTPAGLTQHKEAHGEKNHVCDMCPAAFLRMGDLKKHKVIHTGQKDHVCQVCHKAFYNISKLNVHRRVHTGDKPCVCDVCGRGFSQTSNLKKHKLTHSGQKSGNRNLLEHSLIPDMLTEQKSF